MSAEGGAAGAGRVSLDNPKLLHDLRTPLNAVIGYSEMWLETLEPTHGAFGALQAIREAGLRLLGVLNERLSQQALRSAADPRAQAAEVRVQLTGVVGEIKDTSERVLEEARRTGGPKDYQRDLELILTSACRFQVLLDELVTVREARPGRTSSQEAIPVVTPAAVRPLPREAGLKANVAGSQDVGHVLVVEDNEVNRDLLCRRLIAQGHQVTEAESGEQALALLQDQSFDLVLLDVLMPGMDGYQVLEQLKDDEKLRHVPVVVISALNEIESVVRCIQGGAEDYLHKPIDPVLLKARVDACLSKKRLRERELIYLQQLSEARERSEELLLNVLPAPIAERLKTGEKLIVDRFPDVTVLFFDLVGFSNLAAKVSPVQLVELLNQLFCAFDRLTAKCGVEKIKTIGDGYMAVGGLPIPSERHHHAVAELALEMARAVTELNFIHRTQLSFRIGMHTGPVVAGIIGDWKFSYDLWGDTVNLASRMESHSLPGKIQVSAETRARLGDAFEFESRGEIEVKGLGSKEVFFLVGPRAAARAEAG